MRIVKWYFSHQNFSVFYMYLWSAVTSFAPKVHLKNLTDIYELNLKELFQIQSRRFMVAINFVLSEIRVKLQAMRNVFISKGRVSICMHSLKRADFKLFTIILYTPIIIFVSTYAPIKREFCSPSWRHDFLFDDMQISFTHVPNVPISHKLSKFFLILLSVKKSIVIQYLKNCAFKCKK